MRRAGTPSGSADRMQVEKWIAEGLGRLPGRFSCSAAEPQGDPCTGEAVPGRGGPGLSRLILQGCSGSAPRVRAAGCWSYVGGGVSRSFLVHDRGAAPAL